MHDLSYLRYEQMKDIDDVVSRFEALENRLQQSEYRLLHNFNKTYLIITQHVREAIRKDMFEDPAFLNYFDAHFAKYYLDALDGYLTGKHIAPAWQAAFDGCAQQKVSPIMAMALGVNAHVNNDISLVLHDCNATKMHYQDYIKINDIITQSIFEVLDNLDKHRVAKVVPVQQKIIKYLCKPVLSLIIRRWRHNAWKHYIQMQQQDKNTQDIESYARNYTVRLRKLPL